jgi:uncharacterized protein (TIGR03437 family)
MKKLALFALICLHSPLSSLPLWFEPNQGQAHASVQFQSRNIYLRATSAAIHVDSSPIVFTLEHANGNAHAEAVDQLPGVSNYYLGNDPRKWRTDVPHFARVQYHDVYQGIDVIYYGNAEGKLEYDFVVQPGSDPDQIQIAFNRTVHATSDGDLLVAGLRQHRPKVYQHGREVACDYIVDRERHVKLALARYDHTEPLTIDPVIEYSTYLGGNGDDFATGIAVDASDSAYIVGSLESPRYPNLDPFQQTSGTSKDIVVAKFTPSGNALAFYTYIGGSAQNTGQAIAVDASNNVYITGYTSSVDFPTKNAAQPTFGGGYANAIIVKLSSSGRLVYSTYLGGNNQEEGYGIALASDGAAFVTGFTYSANFPVKDALQPVKAGGADAFLAKLSPAGDKFQFATYLGGSSGDTGYTIALDRNGNPIVVGKTLSTDFPVQSPLQASSGASINGFIAKLSSAGDKLLYSTYFGAAAVSELDFIAIDSSGALYVCGYAFSDGLPTKSAIQPTYGGGQTDALLAKLTPAGDSIVYATYLGGSGNDGPSGLVADRDGNVYLVGATSSSNFPLKNSLQPFVGSATGLKYDAFVAKISPSDVLFYSTVIGGAGNDQARGIALDSRGAVHVVGVTNSTDFPTKNPLQGTFGGGFDDMFYLRLAPEAAPPSPFSTSPVSVPFRYVIGDPVPPSQTVSVTNSGGAVSFTPISTAAWLKVTASRTVTPTTLTISVDPSGLKPEPYTATIQIDAQTSVLVNLTVLAPGPVVTGISPAVIALGSEATTVTITGSGFQPGATVQLTGGVALATQFIDTSTLQITLDKPSLAQPVTLSFAVVNPNSVPSNALMLTIGAATPMFTAAGVVNAASFTSGSVAPGEIVSIFGTNLTGSATFDGTPASPFFASPTQVNVTVPYSVTGSMTVLQMGTSSVQLQVAPSAPGIFAAASAGDNILVLYATGCGALTNDDLPRCALAVSVTVNEGPAQVLYAGIAPGLVQGANQINIKLPDDIASGQVSIVLTAGDASSKAFSFTLP